jgi:2-methylcitrate dehydratase PrpD
MTETTMLPRPGITPTLARFVVDTTWQDIPEKARHEAKRALLNFFAVAIAGCRTEPVELALKSLAEFSGGKQATIIGRTERIDALGAAFLNAASANVFDYCDTHLPTVVHPTAPLAPALLSLAELRRVTGPELLLAFVLGFEIECRVGGAISPGHYPKGWHITSTCGVFGAAAGAAKLLQLKQDQVVWALGNASTQSAGLCECLGWPAKSVSVGNAARNGLFSALLAEKGFAGPAEPIAGAQGFLAAMGEPPNWAALTDGLGKTWEVTDNSIKPYPAGFVIHPLLDCALDWRRQHPGAAVDRIAVRGNPLLLQRTDRPDVATGRESQVSLQHASRRRWCSARRGSSSLPMPASTTLPSRRCDARSRWRAIRRSRRLPLKWISGPRTATSTASRRRPRAAARPTRWTTPRSSRNFWSRRRAGVRATTSGP